MARAVPCCVFWVELGWFSAGRIPRMYAYNANHYAAGRFLGVVLAAWLIPLFGMAGAMEERFDLLQIGTRTLTNVTVTTKAKSYVFLVHAGGMTSIKTAELPPPCWHSSVMPPRAGINPPPTPRPPGSNGNSPKSTCLHSSNSTRNGVETSWQLAAMNLLTSKRLFVILGIASLLYLFRCYCCMLICHKTGNPPGVLVWLPILKLFPLLRAAGMSAWWFLAYCVPVANIVAQILWCLNIAKARTKGVWVGVLLLLPITNLFAFLYLAFSNGAPAEEEATRAEDHDSGGRLNSLE